MGVELDGIEINKNLFIFDDSEICMKYLHKNHTPKGYREKCRFLDVTNYHKFKCTIFDKKLEKGEAYANHLGPQTTAIKCDECKKEWEKSDEKRKAKRVIRCAQCKKGPCLYEWCYDEGSDKHDEYTTENDLVRHFDCPEDVSPCWGERTLVNKAYFDQ